MAVGYFTGVVLHNSEN